MKLPRFLTIRREPDFVIGMPADPYLRRWWIVPRNRWLNVYLHHIRKPDEGKDLHDHPYHNISIVLRGLYVERIGTQYRVRYAGDFVFRRASTPHRIVLVGPGTAWTLFITGPRIREWGFTTAGGGWVHWKNQPGGCELE